MRHVGTRAAETTSTPVVGEALLHPITVAAVLVLLLNDHVLKSFHPGMLTGKLSDFAGLVFFPLLLLTLVDATIRLLRGPRGLTHQTLIASVLVTGLVFSAVKTTSTGAEALRRAGAALQWPARSLAAHRVLPVGRVKVVQDATDLAALPALLIAYWVGRKVIARAESGALRPGGA